MLNSILSVCDTFAPPLSSSFPFPSFSLLLIFPASCLLSFLFFLFSTTRLSSYSSAVPFVSVPQTPLNRYSLRPLPSARVHTMVVIDKHEYLSEEEKRLKEDRERTRYWKRWGPYVAERQWATGWSCPGDG